MGIAGKVIGTALHAASGAALFMAMTAVFGQVSPNQVSEPRAKIAEEKYLAQLQSLHQSIASTRFASPFSLARYLHAKPGQRAALDSGGIEFVGFQDRVVLKISGAYKTVYNATVLSRNERACRTLESTVVPILRFVAQQIPKSADYDGIGFEIIYDTRNSDTGYDYEGKEVLTVIFDRDDAFTYPGVSDGPERQKLLNRADIYVNGSEFGLALGRRDAFDLTALDRAVPGRLQQSSSSAGFNPGNPDFVSRVAARPAASVTHGGINGDSEPSFGNAVRLQDRFQSQLDEMVRGGGPTFHFDATYPPTFEVSGDQTVLHLTLRNTLPLEHGASSIYKRAARGFDLLLAPQLRDLSRRLPVDEGYNALDLSVLNELEIGSASPEIVDYICPLSGLRSFVESKITSQDLINQSVVLVNGVRIGLNLEAVE